MKKLTICLTGFLSLIIIFIIPCYGGECPGDFDNDGDVDGSDLAIFAADFGKTECTNSTFEALQMQIDELRERLDTMQPRENVEVYDFDGQFIGHLYGYAPNSYFIDEIGAFFIPAIGAFAKFNHAGMIFGPSDWIGYSEYDCGGDAYRFIGDQGAIKTLKTFGDKYWIFDPSPVAVIIKSSYTSNNGGQCNNYNPPQEKTSNLAVEIEESEIPFNLPVAFPLRYK